MNGDAVSQLLTSIQIGIKAALIVLPAHYIIVLLFRKSRPSNSVISRIRAKTDWHGRPSVFADDQEHQFVPQLLQVEATNFLIN